MAKMPMPCVGADMDIVPIFSICMRCPARMDSCSSITILLSSEVSRVLVTSQSRVIDGLPDRLLAP